MDRTLSELVQTFHLSASVPSASLWSRAAQWCLGACEKQGMLCKTDFSMLWCSFIAIYLCPQQPGAQCIYCVLRAFLKTFSAALQYAYWYKNVHSLHGRASMEFRMLLFLPCIFLLFLACFNHWCSLILLRNSTSSCSKLGSGVKQRGNTDSFLGGDFSAKLLEAAGHLRLFGSICWVAVCKRLHRDIRALYHHT